MTNPKKVTRRVFRGYATRKEAVRWAPHPLCGSILDSGGVGRGQLTVDTHHVRITVETWEIGKGKKK